MAPFLHTVTISMAPVADEVEILTNFAKEAFYTLGLRKISDLQVVGVRASQWEWAGSISWVSQSEEKLIDQPMAFVSSRRGCTINPDGPLAFILMTGRIVMFEITSEEVWLTMD